MRLLINWIWCKIIPPRYSTWETEYDGGHFKTDLGCTLPMHSDTSLPQLRIPMIRYLFARSGIYPLIPPSSIPASTLPSTACAWHLIQVVVHTVSYYTSSRRTKC